MSDNTDYGYHEAEKRKLSAHTNFEATRDQLLLSARRSILRLLLDGAPAVTADDIRETTDNLPPSCPGPPNPVDQLDLPF